MTRRMRGLGLTTMLAVLGTVAGGTGRVAAQSFDIEEKCNRDFQVAMEYFRSLQLADALELFTTVVEACPDYLEAYLYKGRCEAQMKQYGEAVDTFRAGLDVDPEHQDIRQQLAYALVQDNRTEDGIEVYKGLLSDQPESVDIWRRLSNAAYSADEKPDAIMAGAQAVELRPDSLDLWKSLDYMFTTSDLVVPSLQSAQKIMIREPANLAATSRVAGVYNKTKQYGRAVVAYEKIWDQLFPETGEGAEYSKARAFDMWIYSGVLKNLKQLEDAARVAEKVLEHEAFASNVGAHVNLAFIYKDTKRYDDCVRMARAALALDVSDCSAKAALGKGLEGQALELERAGNIAAAVTRMVDAKNHFATSASACASSSRWGGYLTAEAGRMDEHLKRLRQKQ